MRFVEQNPHELRDSHRWMCIVELDSNLIGKRSPIAVVRPEAPHEIGERAGYEKVLLHKTQSLAHACVVVGIQDPSQRLGLERLRKRSDEIADTELLKVEIIICSPSPEPECIDGLAAIANDRAIERNTNENRLMTGDCPQDTGTYFE